jgi:hypothetical protein
MPTGVSDDASIEDATAAPSTSLAARAKRVKVAVKVKDQLDPVPKRRKKAKNLYGERSSKKAKRPQRPRKVAEQDTEFNAQRADEYMWEVCQSF